jgi:hypothetical protein
VISKRHFVNKLKELRYQFKEQLHYQERYRLKGGTHIVHVPRKDILDELYVRSTLKQVGLSKSEIDKFIGEAKS